MENWFRVTDESIHMDMKVSPGASKNAIAGIVDKRLCVRIAAVPEDGKANACLRGFMAKTLGCAKRDVILLKGEKSRLKTITVPASCEDKLKQIIGGNT